MEGYGRAKLRIFERQHAADTAVLNDDDPWVAALGELPGDGRASCARTGPTPRRSDSAGRACGVTTTARTSRSPRRWRGRWARRTTRSCGQWRRSAPCRTGSSTSATSTASALERLQGHQCRRHAEGADGVRGHGPAHHPRRLRQGRRLRAAGRRPGGRRAGGIPDRPGRPRGWRRWSAPPSRPRCATRWSRHSTRRCATRSRARRSCWRRRARRSTSSRATRRAATASARSPRPAAPWFRLTGPCRRGGGLRPLRGISTRGRTNQRRRGRADRGTRRPRRRDLPVEGQLLLLVTLGLTAIGQVMVYSASSPVAMTTARYGHDPLYFVKNGVVFTVGRRAADAAGHAPAGGAVQGRWRRSPRGLAGAAGGGDGARRRGDDQRRPALDRRRADHAAAVGAREVRPCSAPSPRCWPRRRPRRRRSAS